MTFASEYKKLNPAQKQAVDTIEGPVMVLAGPGTGKTHILTLRIANILKQSDVLPQNILALTFTDSAAKTMRSRLIGLIGAAAYNVRIETFHALCDAIIREYPEYFPFEFDSLPISQVEQFDLIRSFLDSPRLKFLRTAGSKYHYASDLVNAISALKREKVTPDTLKQIVTDETTWFETERAKLKKTELLKWEPLVGKHQELVEIYSRYQQALQKKSRYDFDDMLLEVHTALLANPLLLGALQEQFQYILVDEYQDTNGAQNAIVDTLASFWTEPNLFVVGDPNQTIFRFQGALLENSLGFLDRYRSATLITLNQGYRSNQSVYDAARSLIATTLANSDHPLNKSLTTALKASHSKGRLKLQVTDDDSDELLLLTENVKTLLGQGVSPETIAILYKRNADGEILADLFSRAGIDVHRERDGNALENEILRQFFNLLTLINSLTAASEKRLMFEVLGYDWFSPTKELKPLELLKLTRDFATQKTQLTPFDYLLKDQKLSTVTQQFSTWVTREGKLTFPQFVELVARDSGLLEYLVAPGNHAALQSYIVCFKEITRLARGQKNYRLNDFLSYLATMEDQGLSLPLDSWNSTTGVTLSTVHKAKGREWEHVFIPFLREGYWGKTREKSGLRLPEGIMVNSPTSDQEADERRLLFVALTRAKHTVHLSYPKTIKNRERSSDALPSPYLQEIKTLTKTEVVKLDKALDSLFITAKTPINVDAETRDWLSSLLTTFTLSYSSLNTYLEDPQKFYQHYILKLPEATQPHLAFGNAVHSALEHYYKIYREKEYAHLSPEVVIPTFERKLASYLLDPDDEARRREQGFQVLRDYLSHRSAFFPRVLAIEESFGWKRGKILVGDTQLVGKIDRIDLVEDGDKQLRVIDYKTGNPKTLGDIEGKTKASNLSPRELLLPESLRGRMKRQLLFYKLLLSLDPKYRDYRVEQGVFEFVVPTRGKFVSRNITLHDEDVEALKLLIQTVNQEIKELRFLTV